MAYSFVAIPEKSGHMLDGIGVGRNESVDKISLCGWRLLVRTLSERREDYLCCRDTNDGHYLLVGDITNLEEIRTIAAIYTSEAVTARPVELLVLLVGLIGVKALAFIEGPFNLVRFTGDGRVAIMSDTLGLQPAHILFGRQLWITSELKAVGLVDPEIFQFEQEELVVNAVSHLDDYTPIKNSVKAKPGAVTTVHRDNNERSSVEKLCYLDYRCSAPRLPPLPQAQKLIFDLLSGSVARILEKCSAVAIPLSGGLDSSFVTALAVRTGKTVFTYGIGTPAGDEFQFSRRVSEYLDTRHHELLIDETDVIDGIKEAIFYNEIFDGLSAEIQSCLVCLYRFLGGRHKRIITGYGADLLFGGVLKPDVPETAVNPILWDQIYRTRWTGEFSIFSAVQYGTLASHPFWTPRLIGLAADLAPELKVSKFDVKVILRACADAHQMLPPEIIKRPKIGIHEGSSVNRLFGQLIGAEAADYKAKTRHAYRLFQKAITGRAKPLPRKRESEISLNGRRAVTHAAVSVQ